MGGWQRRVSPCQTFNISSSYNFFFFLISFLLSIFSLSLNILFFFLIFSFLDVFSLPMSSFFPSTFCTSQHSFLFRIFFPLDSLPSHLLPPSQYLPLFKYFFPCLNLIHLPLLNTQNLVGAAPPSVARQDFPARWVGLHR